VPLCYYLFTGCENYNEMIPAMCLITISCRLPVKHCAVEPGGSLNWDILSAFFILGVVNPAISVNFLYTCLSSSKHAPFLLHYFI